MGQPLCWVLGAGCWVLEQDGEQGRLDPSQQLPCATGEIRHQTKEYGIANLVCPMKWFSTFSYFLKWKLPTYTSVQKILSDNFLSKSFWVKNCNYQSEFLINKDLTVIPQLRSLCTTGRNWHRTELSNSVMGKCTISSRFLLLCVHGGGGQYLFLVFRAYITDLLATFIDPWFSSMAVHQNHLEGLLNLRFLANLPPPRASE